METYTRIPKRYQQHCELGGKWITEESKHCCDTLTYKYHLINMNVGIMLKDKHVTAESFRKVVKHELANDDCENEHSQLLFMFSTDRVDELSDNEIWR